MTDPRFYHKLGPVAARDLAVLAEAELRGDPRHMIEDVAPAGSAGGGDLVFITDERRAQTLQARPAACVAPPELAESLSGACSALLLHSQPRAAFARMAARLWEPIEPVFGPEAISPDAEIAPDAVIGPGAVIGSGARIGAGARIGPNAMIGRAVEIGAECCIAGGAWIAFAQIGARTEIGANTVIGGAGFGVAPAPEGPVSIPHLGLVRIGDDVRIGALCAVDRGMLDDTVIESEAKIDNLCQIAHNCRIGRGAIIAAFAGLSGSSTVGAGAMLAGRVGLADHVTIGDGAIVGPGSGVMHDVPAGEHWLGYPAQPHRQYMRSAAAFVRMGRSGKRGKSS